MAKKKKKSKKKTAKKTSKKVATKRVAKKKAAKKGEPRACGVCDQLGHNKRSHDPGGKLAG